MAKSKKQQELEQKVGELTADLQRIQADFENYRKRVEEEKIQVREDGARRTVLQLLPIIDNIDRATGAVPEHLKEEPWVKGVSGVQKQLTKHLAELDLEKIEAKNGTKFDPELHQAVQFDEDATGDTEVIDEELQAGYRLKGTPIRHAMVKVTKR
jgi:molecular chaperone GrpE